MEPITWLAGIVGPKFAKPVFYGSMIVLVLGSVFLLGRCTGGNDDAAEQAKQTNRSGAAVSAAAEMAINKVENRRVTDAAIDQAVGQTISQIGMATSADDVRAAVIAGVCKQPSHRNDPACKGPTK